MKNRQVILAIQVTTDYDGSPKIEAEVYPDRGLFERFCGYRNCSYVSATTVRQAVLDLTLYLPNVGIPTDKRRLPRHRREELVKWAAQVGKEIIEFAHRKAVMLEEGRKR